jgi:hypothetical protein
VAHDQSPSHASIIYYVKETKKFQAIAIFLNVVVEKQKKRVGQAPVCVKCFLRTTGQATIAPNAPITQDRIRLQEPALSPSKGDIVHRTFANTPPTLITLAWVKLRLWHQKTQQCV